MSRRDPQLGFVLFVDIVGYSKDVTPVQADKVALLLKIARECPTYRNARRRRKVIGGPSGDGFVLAFFDEIGSPLRCAQELAEHLARLRQFQLRMGVHIGPVEVGDDISKDDNVYGEGVNTAARAMQFAHPGELVVTERAFEIANELRDFSNKFELLGSEEVKHGATVTLYRLIHPALVSTLPHRDLETARRIHTKATKGGKQAASVEMIAFRLGRIRRDFMVGLVLLASVELLHKGLTQFSFGQKMELWAYEQLHGQIQAPDGSLPVRVVSLGEGFRRADVPSHTDMAKVAALIHHVQENNVRPSVIGVDIDFTAEVVGESVKFPDPELRVANSIASFKPTLLGYLVVRVAEHDPANWLGSPTANKHVVHPYAPKDYLAQRPILLDDIVMPGSEKSARGLAAAIADAIRQAHNIDMFEVTVFTTPYASPFRVTQKEEGKKGHEEDFIFEAEQYFLNPAPLGRLKRETIHVESPEALDSLDLKGLQGTAMLIGRVDDIDDRHSLAGADVEGVYFHALGVLSRVFSPVRQFHAWVEIALAMIASSAVLLIVSAMRRKHIASPAAVSDDRLRMWLTQTLIVTAFVTSVVLVRAFNILWTDFMLVAFALALDPLLEPKLHKLFHGAKVAIQEGWSQGVVFKRRSS